MLVDLFKHVGNIKHCKVLYPSKVDPYCFIEFFDHQTAEKAIRKMNGHLAFEKHLRVNWALSGPGGQNSTDDFPVFVGDLPPEVDEDLLQRHFAKFGNVVFVRIMRDPTTGKSRSYGFVTYADKESAELSISKMNGYLMYGKPIKANWAIKKGKPHSFEEVTLQSSRHNSTIYIGNLAPSAVDKHIRKHCEQFGSVLALRRFPEKGYAFVKYESHETATKAICSMNGQSFCGQIIKCSWGKENFDLPARQQVSMASTYQPSVYSPTSAMSTMYTVPYYYNPIYSTNAMEGQSGSPLTVPMTPALLQSPYTYTPYAVPQSPTYIQTSQPYQVSSGHFMQMATGHSALFPTTMYQLPQQQKQQPQQP
jgi:RNA recognition motif-containing protein